jgi:hypothetical protein
MKLVSVFVRNGANMHIMRLPLNFDIVGLGLTGVTVMFPFMTPSEIIYKAHSKVVLIFFKLSSQSCSNNYVKETPPKSKDINTHIFSF